MEALGHAPSETHPNTITWLFLLPTRRVLDLACVAGRLFPFLCCPVHPSPSIPTPHCAINYISKLAYVSPLLAVAQVCARIHVHALTHYTHSLTHSLTHSHSPVTQDHLHKHLQAHSHTLPLTRARTLPLSPVPCMAAHLLSLCCTTSARQSPVSEPVSTT
jgi:hypothetical protein